MHVFDSVMNEVDLSIAIELAQDRVADHRIVPSNHAGFDRHAILRWCFQVRDISNTHKRHVQRTWDRSGREGQHIDLARGLLEAFLEFDSKLLFLVDDQQTKVKVFDV